MNKDVLVILPVYNGASFLNEALESIEKQTIPVKCAIVDDASTDETISIVEKFKHRLDMAIYCNREKKGIGYCSNLALKDNQVEYYFNFSYDDILYPNYVETALTYLNANQQLSVFIPAMQVFGDENFIWQPEGIKPEIKRYNTCFFSSIVRKSLWDKLGGYSENMPYSGWEDWDFWSRAFDVGAISMVWREPLIKYRTHPKNLSKENALKIAELTDWMRRNNRII